MVCHSQGRLQPPQDERPARSLAETVQRLRLAKLADSRDPLAASIATTALLFLPRLDELIEQDAGRVR